MIEISHILKRLEDLGFDLRRKQDMFDQDLPLLHAVAVDGQAHQLVLVASEERLSIDHGAYEEVWRELLFAVGGLRHHLMGGLLPAHGAPILLALVSDVGETRLRGLVEEITAEYALFARVDLNVVRRDAPTDELDRFLAPLLPAVREALAKNITVASQDVQAFWSELEGTVREAATEIGRASCRERVLRLV